MKAIKLNRILGLSIIIVLSVSTIALASEPEEMIAALFTSPSLKAEWFTSAFLSQVPIQQINAIIIQYRSMLGEYESVTGQAPVFRASFEKGYVDMQIVLDKEGKIAGLWLDLPVRKSDTIDNAIKGFSELPGEVSLIVVSSQGVMASINPDKPLAVGSAFKLLVLAALKAEIEAGNLAWDDVVLLDKAHLSLPSGILNEWPAGTALTIDTLATLMISISDNTATDVLINILGREKIEALNVINTPFLTTREAFILKDPANQELLTAYRNSDVTGKHKILSLIASLPLPDASIFSSGPLALDIEWFFSVNDLANLIYYVGDLPLFSVNPGVAAKSDWQHIAFKGGSEPGVINLTTLLVSNSEAFYVASVTWNNNEVLDETQFISLYSGLINAIKQQDSN